MFQKPNRSLIRPYRNMPETLQQAKHYRNIAEIVFITPTAFL